MTVIAVIDYDMGNLHSACKGLEQAGAKTHITDSYRDLEQADAVVLPGVGAFDPAIQHLRSRDLIQPIRDIIAGLGVIPGMVRRFRPEPGLTIPHMGWNQLQLTQPASPLWRELPANPWVYFVHSYYAEPSQSAMNAAMITHGTQTVTAAIAHNNVMAVQFHPEKSSTAGLQILSNFVASVRQPELVEA
jgi:glutamine amidotransferase